MEWLSDCSWTTAPRSRVSATVLEHGSSSKASTRWRQSSSTARLSDRRRHVPQVGHRPGEDNELGTWHVEVWFRPALPVAKAAEASDPLPRADMYEIPFNQVRKMALPPFGATGGRSRHGRPYSESDLLERTPHRLLHRPRTSRGNIGTATPVVRRTVNCEGELSHIAIEVSDVGGTFSRRRPFLLNETVRARFECPCQARPSGMWRAGASRLCIPCVSPLRQTTDRW